MHDVPAAGDAEIRPFRRESIEELRDLFEGLYGVRLTFDEALELGNDLVALMDIARGGRRLPRRR